MSKAFTSEESTDQSVPGRLAQRASPGEERPITIAGHSALQDELNRLHTADLPAARSAGLAGEADVRRLEHRGALLAATLASVRPVTPVRDGVVRFGSHVALAWEDGRRQRLQLVGPDEAEPREGRISVDSPLARALLGRVAGDAVEIARPRGVEEVVLESIE